MAEIITSEIEIQSGVISSGLSVETGGIVTVLSGGTVTESEAANYGWFWIEEGGHISNIHLTHSGDAMVNGGLAENLTMENGGMADIFSGVMRTGTILNGGYGAIYETGSGLNVAVSAGGRYLVNGGYGENTTVSSGGSFVVQHSGGLASRTTILTGGSARVVSAGEMKATTLNGGNLQVLSGVASQTQVQSGGSLFVDAAGEAFDTTLNDGGILDVLSGTIYDTLAAGGKVDLKKAVAFSLTVNGGTVFADSDSIITGALLNKGGTLSVRSGTLVTGCEFRGGTALIERGAVFSSSIVRSGGDVTAQDGEIYRTVAIDQTAKMYVQSGAVVTDAVAVKDAELIVQSEGVVSGADVVGGVVTLTGGTALDVSLGKTTLPFSSGWFSTPSVVSYGSARLVADRTAALCISSGGLAVGIYASNGDAYRGSEYVGIYVGDGGVASDMTIHQAAVYVSCGGVARDITISGYELSPMGGYVTTHYPSWGKVVVLAGGLVEDIDLNQAILKISGGTVRNLVASNWSVIDLSEGGVIGGALELTGSAKLTLGSNGGTIDFDISETAPGAAAVKKGLSLIEGAPLYTLTVSGTQETGIYHLATDSPSFAGAFTVRNTDLTPLGTLTVGGSVLIGDLYYTVKVRNVNVDLVISMEVPPPDDPYAVYVDSAWSGKPFSSIVELAGGGTATIGYDAFADGDEAVAAVKPGGVVYITGGAVSFADVVARNVVVLGGATISGAVSDYDAVVTLESGASATGITVRGESKLTLKSGSVCRDLSFIDQAATVKVESGATISGAYFAKSYEGITIDGTIEFDLSKPGAGTPLRGLSMYSGTPTCVITVDAASLKTGQYILASDMSYKFGQYSYTVRDIDGTVLGVIPAAFVVDNQVIYGTAEIGDFRYTISYKGGVGYGMGDAGSAVTLSVEKIDPDKESYVYLNASWKDKAAGESVTVTLLTGGTQTAVIGRNAFAVLDDAVNAVAEDGTIAISYTKPSQSGIIVIGGGTATVISGTDVSVDVSGETASGTGGTQTEDGMIYSFPEGLPRNIDLIGTGAKIENALVQATLSISNSIATDLSVVEGGGIVAVSGATCISVDVAAGGSFLCRSSYNLIRDLRVVSGGTFGMYTDTYTYPAVGSASGLTGTCVFESGADITINGTVNFDLSGSTAGGVLFDGLKYAKGNTQYEITVGEAQESGLYHLAVNANELTDGVTLYVGEKNYFNNAGKLTLDQTVWIADRGFLLTFADGALDLMVIAFEPQTTVYLNAAWAGLEKYTVVEVPGGTAVLGIDAFADLMPAMSACMDDGSVIIEGGTYTFSGTVEKNLSVRNTSLNADSLVLIKDLTLDAGAVLIGGLTVSDSYSYSQSAGSIVCSGSVRLNEGATAAGTIVVNSKHGIVLDNAALTGTITVNTGGILSGRETFTDGMDITVNGFIDFDISGSTAGGGALMRGLSKIKGSPTYTLTVDVHQEAGTYWLADDAAGFNGSITIRKRNGAVLGTLTAGKTAQINGTYYTLRGAPSEGKMQLYLLVGEQTPPATVYLSTDWRWTGDGSLVEVPGGTANIGYNAFYEADDAINASLFGGSAIEIIRGMYSFTSDLEIPGDIVVNGGTLSVSADGSRISGNITVNSSSLLILEEGASLGGSIVLNTGGSLTLKNGMAVSGMQLSDWGTLLLSNGSSATDITLVSNGSVKVDEGGFASNITFKTGFSDVNSGGFLSGATVTDQGYLTVKEGGTASDITVYGGNLTAEYGGTISSLTVVGNVSVKIRGKLTGRCSFGEGANIIVGSDQYDAPSWPPPSDWIPPDATVDFDLSYTSVDGPALYEGFSCISCKGTPIYTLTVSAAQENGEYLLADGVTEFNSTITVTNATGASLGTLRLNSVLHIGDVNYRLTLNDGVLSVDVFKPTETLAKCDVDGNGVSDVLFQYTGGDNQTGYWLNGKDEWRSSNCAHPVEWTLLGAYDMDGDGLADSVFVGNGVVVDGVKGAYIGYYKSGVDSDENWVNIDFLENEADNKWVNKIGNLTGNPGANSIVWHCADLGAIGVWTDGTSEWTQLGIGFDANWTLVGCGDFNGDGRDSIVMSYLDGTKYYAIGIDGSAVDMGNLNWSGWEVRAIGDFAGDGKDDMILFHKEYGAVVMLADGKLDNYTSIGQLDAQDWFIVGAGDYDGDAKDDLLVRQYSTGMLGYYSACDTSKWVEMGRGVDMDWTVIA